MKWRVTLSDLTYSDEERRAVERVLASRWLTMGPVTERFESEFARFVGCKHAIAVSSGTAALFLALRALGIGAEDEVIVPSLSFVATANVALYCGAKPVFCDIESLQRPLISAANIRSAVNARTRAILPMHYAGFACNLVAIRRALAPSRSITIVEDAAHAAGAKTADGRSLGTLGRIGCFSFFSNKNLAVGEGGMVVTDDAKIAKQVRLMRSHGLTAQTFERHVRGSGRLPYDVIELGYNFRPTEISSALGRVQLAKLPANNRTRAQLTHYYHKKLSELDEVLLPFAATKPGEQPAYHILPILLRNERERDRVREHLTRQGIQTSHHYVPIHLLSFYQKILRRARPCLPLTEAYARRQLTLPLHPLMTERDVDLVVREIERALSRRIGIFASLRSASLRRGRT
jgi:dTDP-4-amino-4,6-dideoxygalactose transaminase